MGRKATNDPNLFAKRVFDSLLDKLDPEAAADQPKEQQPTTKKTAKAVKAARVVASKGGEARAAKLSPRKRKQIAKKAALARWKREE